MSQLHKEVMQILENNGFRAYLVGGCIRNKLLGLPIKDYDVVTQATPEEVLDLFTRQEKTFSVDLIGAHFGVSLIKDSLGNSLEIATMRSDGVYSDNRHPDEVKYTINLVEDLKRRDFTINALVEDSSGRIWDFLGGGFKDLLTNREISCIGDAKKRFTEDALRILRAIRFQSQIGFDIEHSTMQQMYALKGRLANLSKERIREELNKILTGEFRVKACGTLLQWDFLEFVTDLFPYMEWVEKFLKSLELSDSLTYCLTALLYYSESFTKPSNFLQTLKYSNDITNIVEANLKALNEFPNFEGMTTSQRKKFIRQNNFNEIIKLQESIDSSLLIEIEVFKCKVTFYSKEFTWNELLWPIPHLNGDDLIKMGLTPSPKFKEILNEIENQQLEHEDKFTKDMAIELAKVMYDKN